MGLISLKFKDEICAISQNNHFILFAASLSLIFTHLDSPLDWNSMCINDAFLCFENLSTYYPKPF